MLPLDLPPTNACTTTTKCPFFCRQLTNSNCKPATIETSEESQAANLPTTIMGHDNLSMLFGGAAAAPQTQNNVSSTNTPNNNTEAVANNNNARSDTTTMPRRNVSTSAIMSRYTSQRDSKSDEDLQIGSSDAPSTTGTIPPSNNNTTPSFSTQSSGTSFAKRFESMIDRVESKRDSRFGLANNNTTSANAPTANTNTTSGVLNNNPPQTTAKQQNQQQHPATSSTIEHTRPGTESIQHFKRFGSNIGSMALNSRLGSRAVSAVRELQLAEKLNAMNIDNEQMQNEKEVHRMQCDLEEQDRAASNTHFSIDDEVGTTSENTVGRSDSQLARELQEKEDEMECERVKHEADMACQRVTWRYDALVKFTNSDRHGAYAEFVEFLLMGGGRRESDAEGLGDDELLFENFYEENSEYRKLWNDNLTLGFPESASTLEGRAFVPAVESTASNSAKDHAFEPWPTHRQRSFSEDDDRPKNFGQTWRDRTFSAGEKLDKEKIKQGLGSAVTAISNVSSFALKPLRDLQLAEKLNAMNIDMEEDEARTEIEKYNRMQEEKRDLEEMMRLKQEAEERCLVETKDHLLNFITEYPDVKYNQWIEDLHPENAHDGTLLEGMGKTIDHRFFVEESDHRIMWNDNLFTFLDRDTSTGRDFVPPRAKQMDVNGEMVVAADILSGSLAGHVPEVSPQNYAHDTENRGSDLIAFD